MYKALIVAVSLLLSAAYARAEPSGEKAEGLESKNYKWNTQNPEKTIALKLAVDVKAGEEAYKANCSACHLASGAGSPDGSIPQLAGQHSTVIIKQLADIRSGLRSNPVMYLFAVKLPDAQALANVAAFIETLCVPRDSGKYEGSESTQLIAYGKALYDRECVQCHQANGIGIKDKAFPVIAGQHYKYLLRQMIEIRDGKRGNSYPEMVRVIAKYDDTQLVAIAAYQAMLATRLQKLTTQPQFCKPV